MSVVINTNYAATTAANNLAASNAALQKSMNRLSSGSKVVSPADDAGGLAVAMKLAATTSRQGAIANNIANTTSFLQTQDGALQVAGKILDRMSELKTLYTDPTKNSDDRSNYDAEFTELQAELTSITSEKFNAISLFGSSDLAITVNDDATASVTVQGRNLTDSASGVGVLTDSAVATLGDVTLTEITDALQHVATFRAQNGAEQSRLSFASELLTINKSNLEQAKSRITDVDVAQESTQLARWNILVQSGTAMLAQANQSSQVALKLLQS